jgi:hypothetical protein
MRASARLRLAVEGLGSLVEMWGSVVTARTRTRKVNNFVSLRPIWQEEMRERRKYRLEEVKRKKEAGGGEGENE